MVGNTVVGGRIAAVSSNAGENNSESDLRLTVTMKAGDTLSFDYCVSSGVDTDRFICTVGTKVLMEISGETAIDEIHFHRTDRRKVLFPLEI